MSVQTRSTTQEPARPALLRRGLLLVAASITWMLIEAVVSLGAGIAAGSVALLAFGPRSGETELAVIVSWASVAGAALAFAAQLPTVFKLLGRPRFALDHTYPPVRQVLRGFAPVFASRGVVQISAFIDVRLASHIADVGAVEVDAERDVLRVRVGRGPGGIGLVEAVAGQGDDELAHPARAGMGRVEGAVQREPGPDGGEGQQHQQGRRRGPEGDPGRAPGSVPP